MKACYRCHRPFEGPRPDRCPACGVVYDAVLPGPKSPVLGAPKMAGMVKSLETSCGATLGPTGDVEKAPKEPLLARGVPKNKHLVMTSSEPPGCRT